MKLSELKQGERAIIQKISSPEELKSRLYSFGVAKGSEFYVEACSIGKHNLAIVVDDTVIGLRSSEASQISIKKV
jgi:Fe2+ transport system protein FeoA